MIKSTSKTDSKADVKGIATQVGELDSNIAMITFSNLPTSLLDMAKYITRSPSKMVDGKERGNKVLPVGEDKFSVEYMMADGNIGTAEVQITVWLNKNDVIAVNSAVAKAKEEEEKKALLEKKAEALASLTPEQLQKLLDLGLLK
jgi:hypothetical protein